MFFKIVFEIRIDLVGFVSQSYRSDCLILYIIIYELVKYSKNDLKCYDEAF